jgi:uncharacterized repeat protein (TIGR01451 family)
MTLDAAPVEKDLGYQGGITDAVQFGSGKTGAVVHNLGTAATINLTCAAPGVTTLHLVTPAEGGAFGTTMLAPGGVVILTTRVDGSVECQDQTDISVTKTGDPEPAIAGDNLTYTVTVTNTSTTMAARGLIIGDDLPDNKAFVSAAFTATPIGPMPCVPGWLAFYPLDEDGDGHEDGTRGLPGDDQCKDGIDNDGDGGIDALPGVAGDPQCKGFPNAGFDEDPTDLIDNDGDTLIDEDPPNLNIVQCLWDSPLTHFPALGPGQSLTLTIVVNVPLSDAGKDNTNVASAFLASAGGVMNPTVDPNPDNDSGIWVTSVAPANVEITKTAPGQALTGDPFDYTIELHSTGPSPATDVEVTDALPGGVTFDDVDASCDTAAITCDEASGVVTCNVTDPMPVSETCTITIGVTCAAAGTATNQAEVCWSDPLCAQSNSVDTIQLPPFNGMVKDARPDLPGIQDTANLWLCKTGPDCGVVTAETGAHIGKGSLDVEDLLFLREDTDSPNDSDTLPEGLAAYEEQLKYDHKIFDVTVADAGFDGLDNDADCGADDGNGNGIPCDCALVGGDRICDYNVDEVGESVLDARGRANINCSMTIMTENWIMFGCVTAGQALGNPMPVGVWLKTISLTPDPDMFLRLRPTKDNGVVSTLIDENCEVADIYASEPWPFTLPGGLTQDCRDLTVTVRMLEGDVNLDCQVDVLDEQIIAQRYGAFFGLLLYSPFYDLEPKLTDFDIDIKDLQFVFGRDGSMCQAPIPNQPPEPIPDP